MVARRGRGLIWTVALLGCEVPSRPDLALFANKSGCEALPVGFGTSLPEAGGRLSGGRVVVDTGGGVVVIGADGSVLKRKADVALESVDIGSGSVVLSRLDESGERQGRRPHLRDDAGWVDVGGGRVQWDVPGVRWWPDSGREEELVPEPGCLGRRHWSPDGTAYAVLAYVRGEQRRSNPVDLVICSATGSVVGDVPFSDWEDGSPTIDNGRWHSALPKWSPSSDSLLLTTSFVGMKGSGGRTVVVLDDDQPRSLLLDTSHVSFTEDGQSLLLHQWGRGCRLMRLPEMKIEQLGPVPDSAFAGIGADPHHLRCGPCDGTGAVFVQDEPEGRVRLYDTSGQFLFSTPSPDE